MWLSILFSNLGGQITLLALPLTAVFLLDASPTQIAEQDGKPHPPVTGDFEQGASENVHALSNKPH